MNTIQVKKFDISTRVKRLLGSSSRIQRSLTGG